MSCHTKAYLTNMTSNLALGISKLKKYRRINISFPVTTSSANHSEQFCVQLLLGIHIILNFLYKAIVIFLIILWVFEEFLDDFQKSYTKCSSEWLIEDDTKGMFYFHRFYTLYTLYTKNHYGLGQKSSEMKTIQSSS